jgi:MoaA/NifB/PqqE/SkfB family radical SAM enzyme
VSTERVTVTSVRAEPYNRLTSEQDIMVAAGVDIEVTNRCNAKCHFCPRDMTPHQGLMTPEVFEQSLARTVELHEVLQSQFGTGVPSVNLCGLGEPLLNRRTPDYARQVREAGLACQIISNASLLDEERGRALLDAGVQSVWLNVGERGEDYEAVYKLPFERTRENVVRFTQMAGDDCQVHLVLVDHRQDPDHLEAMREYWRSQGVHQFLQFDIMNRGGTLFVDHMQYEQYPERDRAIAMLEVDGEVPPCLVPFLYLFVGYDGNYYLCCSDWEKKVPLGTVFDASFIDIMAQKLQHVMTREPICGRCNHDPVNKLSDVMRGTDDADEIARTAAMLTDGWAQLQGPLERLAPGLLDAPVDGPRRLIPLTVT